MVFVECHKLLEHYRYHHKEAFWNSMNICRKSNQRNIFLIRGRALVPRGATRVKTVQLLYNRPFYEAFLLKGMFISHSSVYLDSLRGGKIISDIFIIHFIKKKVFYGASELLESSYLVRRKEFWVIKMIILTCLRRHPQLCTGYTFVNYSVIVQQN